MISFKDYFIECMSRDEEPSEEEWLELVELMEGEDDDGE